MKKNISIVVCILFLTSALFSSCGSFVTMSENVSGVATPNKVRLFNKNNRTFSLNVAENQVKNLNKEDIILDQYFKDFSVEKLEFVDDNLVLSINGDLGKKTISSDMYVPSVGTITIPANKTVNGTHITTKVDLDIPYMEVSPAEISNDKEIEKRFTINIHNDALKDFVTRKSLELRGAFSNCAIRSMSTIDNKSFIIKIAGDPDYSMGSGIIYIPSKCTKSGLAIDVPVSFITDTKLFSFNTVATQANTDTYVSLRVSGDNFKKEISPKDIVLDGDFKELKVSETSLSENNSVLSLRLVGEGITNAGTGIITLKKSALKHRKKTSINIPIEPPRLSTSNVLWSSDGKTQTYDIVINANSSIFPSKIDKDIITNYFGLNDFEVEKINYVDSNSIELRFKASTTDYDNASITINKKYTDNLNDISLQLPIYDKVHIIGQVELDKGLPNMKVTAYNSNKERLNNVTPAMTSNDGSFVLEINYSDLDKDNPIIHLEANGKTIVGGMKQSVTLSSDILLKNDSSTEKYLVNVPTTLSSMYRIKKNATCEESILAVKTYFSLSPKQDIEAPHSLNTDVTNFNHYNFVTYSRSNSGVNSYINILFDMLKKNSEEARLKEIGRKFVFTDATPLYASDNIKDGPLKSSYNFGGLNYLQEKAFSSSFKSLINSDSKNIPEYLSSIKNTSNKLKTLHDSIKNTSKDDAILTYFDNIELEYDLIEKLFTEYTYLAKKSNSLKNKRERLTLDNEIKDFMFKIESSNLKDKLENMQNSLLTDNSDKTSDLEALSLYFYQLYPYEHLSVYQLRRYSSFFTSIQLKTMLLLNEYNYYFNKDSDKTFSNTVKENIRTQITYIPSSDKVDIKRTFTTDTTTATGYYVRNNFNGTTFFLSTAPTKANKIFTAKEYSTNHNIRQIYAFRDWQGQPKYIDSNNHGWRTVRNQDDVNNLLQGKNYMYKNIQLRAFFAETISESFQPYKWLYLDEPYGEFGESQEVFDIETNTFKQYNRYRFSKGQDFSERNLWFIYRTR